MKPQFEKVNLVHLSELVQGVCPKNKIISAKNTILSVFQKKFFFKGVLLGFWGSLCCTRFTFLQCFSNVCENLSLTIIYHSKK